MRIFVIVIWLGINTVAFGQDNEEVDSLLNQLKLSMHAFDDRSTDSLMSKLILLDTLALDYLLSHLNDTSYSRRFVWFPSNANFYLQPVVRNDVFFLFMIHAMYQRDIHFVQVSPELIIGNDLDEIDGAEYWKLNTAKVLAHEWRRMLSFCGGLEGAWKTQVDPFLNTNLIDWKLNRVKSQDVDPFGESDD